jgi:hypothetical protein
MKQKIRERVLRMVAQDQTRVEIAKAVGISVRTVYRVLEEAEMELASIRADAVDRAMKHFKLTEGGMNYFFFHNVDKVEKELAKRTYADMPTDKLQRIADSLRKQSKALLVETREDLKSSAERHDLKFEPEADLDDKEGDTPEPVPSPQPPATSTGPSSPIPSHNINQGDPADPGLYIPSALLPGVVRGDSSLPVPLTSTLVPVALTKTYIHPAHPKSDSSLDHQSNAA